MLFKVENDTLTEEYWGLLLDSIKDEKCTPFIGAGACANILPLGREIAEKWAEEYAYPMNDPYDLAKVAQFLAFSKFEMFPKREIKKLFEIKNPPDFSQKDEPHGVLADLDLPVYITTNYDDFLIRALKYRGKEPVQDFCRWNDVDRVRGKKSPLLDASFEPSKTKPIVYHLHGHIGIPESIVLTESDYFDFLSRLSTDEWSAKDEDDALIPTQIRIALTNASLLFIGYSLADWNFLVLFRRLLASVQGSRWFTIAAQLPPEGLCEEKKKAAQHYMNTYFQKIQKGSEFQVYWGEARKFSKELRERLGKI